MQRQFLIGSPMIWMCTSDSPSSTLTSVSISWCCQLPIFLAIHVNVGYFPLMVQLIQVDVFFVMSNSSARQDLLLKKNLTLMLFLGGFRNVKFQFFEFNNRIYWSMAFQRLFLSRNIAWDQQFEYCTLTSLGPFVKPEK